MKVELYVCDLIIATITAIIRDTVRSTRSVEYAPDVYDNALQLRLMPH